MLARRAWRSSALVLGILLPTAPSLAGSPPTWSPQFANAGFTYSVFEQGPVALLPHDSPHGPRLYVGGEYTAIAGVPFRSLAAFDGQRWSNVHGFSNMYNAESVAMMTSMPIDGTPRVVVAGSFDAPQTLDGIAWIDEQDTIRSFPAGPRSPHAWFGSAYAWNSPSGPELIVGSGLFPQNSDYIYRYTQAGWGLMSPGVITITRAYALFDDGTGPAVYIGVPADGAGFSQTVTKWNGSTLTPMTSGLSWVNALCVHDDGTGPALYATGNGFRRYRGGAWEPIPGTPQSGVQALASFDDGDGPALYAAGQFTTAGGAPAANIARWRNGAWAPLGAGLTGGVVKDLAVFDDDGPGPRPAALFAVGKFSQAGGISSPGIARWGVVICPSDYNADGLTTSQDFFEFLTGFFADAADFNHDGVTNSADFFDYVAAFFGAC